MIPKFLNCEGLLLCTLRGSDKFVVWNPYLGQPRWIVPRYAHSIDRFNNMFCYALGYEDVKNKSCRTHKLLRFIDYYSQFYWYEIYDFDSDAWTTLDVTPHWFIASPYNGGVSLKGNTYWCAIKRDQDDLDCSSSSAGNIICFDFAKESFGPLLPLPFRFEEHDYMTLSSVGEEKLAVLLLHNEVNPYELDLWITTKLETEEVSWSKFLRVETFDTCVPFISTESFFLDDEKKVAIGFDISKPRKVIIIGQNGYFKALDCVGEYRDQESSQPSLCSYVPSYVQIKQPSVKERKQESEAEKLRFIENMSRLNQCNGGGWRLTDSIG